MKTMELVRQDIWKGQYFCGAGFPSSANEIAKDVSGTYVLASEANERIKVLETENKELFEIRELHWKRIKVLTEADKNIDELEAERDRLKAEVKDLRYSLEHIEGDERYAKLRARHAALVEAASSGLSLLYELGSPHCNTELALKDIAMVTEELKAALAEVR